MNVLIGCEESGVVRAAFEKRGHFVVSCDLKPTRLAGWHVQGDVLPLLGAGWDLAIFFPTCTYLANSGAKHLYHGMNKKNGPNTRRFDEMRAGAAFFNALLNAPIDKLAVENPLHHKYARALIRKYDQIVQPWWFGHGETKATCLWLKNLPPLQPTNVVAGREPRVHFETGWQPAELRREKRSETRPGVGDAMAALWG